jgi:DNA (cytosine-5)-methyltransferase 1
MTDAVGTIVSLFSGAGGLDLGFELEGFEVAEAVEIDSACVATLRRNRPRWDLDASSQSGHDPTQGGQAKEDK